MLRSANTHAMQLQPKEISRSVAAEAYAIPHMDRADWRKASRLTRPENLTIMSLPARAPELDPIEKGWQCFRLN